MVSAYVFFITLKSIDLVTLLIAFVKRNHAKKLKAF